MFIRWLFLASILYVWFAHCTAFKVGYGPPFFDQPPPPMELDQDHDDIRDYTAFELQAIKELKEIKKGRSFISNFMPPTCTFKKWNRGRCCLSFKWLQKKKKFCLRSVFRVKKLAINIALILNREELIEAEIALSKLCVGIPYLKKLSACLHVYHLAVEFKPKFRFKACAQLTIAGIFALQFNCLKVVDGVVTLDHSVEPEDPGIFVLSFKDGKVVFEFNNPIPPELIEAIKEFGRIVKQKIVVFVRNVVDVVKKVWDEIKNFFECLFYAC